MQERRSLPPYEDELSLALLRSADQDEPSAAAYSKVATALGVSAAVGIGASLPAQAALVSNALSAGAAARWSGSAFAKLALVGVSSVLLVGGVALLRHRAQVGAQAQLAAHARDVAAHARVLAAPIAPSPANDAHTSGALGNAAAAPTPPLSLSSKATPAPSLALGAASPPSVAVAPSVAAGSAPRRAKVSSLPEQVLSLDRARVALNSGDAGAALTEIAHYRSTWPRGVFLTEASVLEIEALAKRGEIVLAGMRAQAFVTAHPDSPQVERLRALIPHAAR